MESIGKKVRSGLTLSSYVTVFTYFFQFSFGIFLARLLNPSDYGLVGMLAIFIVLFEMLVDSGFGASILQKKSPEPIDYNTVFWFNLFVSIVLYLILFISAPFIADFFKENSLVTIIRVLGVVSVINAFGSIQGKYLNKNYLYIPLNKVYVFTLVCSSIIAVLFAYLGFGVWSLIIKSLTFAVMLNFGWWMLSPWKPTLTFSMKSLKSLFGFGSKIFAISIFDSIFNNLYSLIIGKLFSVQKLGYYTRGKQFTDLPEIFIRNGPFTLLFPALSNIQDQDERLLRVYKKILSMLAFLLFPTYAILGCISYPLVKVLLTDKWLPSVVFIQILSFMCIAFPFHGVNSSILIVKGKSQYLLIITVIRRILFLILIFILYRYGVGALAWGMVIDAMIDA